MKAQLLTLVGSLLLCTSLMGQRMDPVLLDSLYGERGIPGTTTFAPDFRVSYPAYDEMGRPLERVLETFNGSGNWVPSQRRLFSYAGNTTTITEQIWSSQLREWRDRRRETTEVEDDLILMRVREVLDGDTLRNQRRWSYVYDGDDQETMVLLERWNGAAWENLSQKLSTYNGNGGTTSQTLQFWFEGNWRNIRRRGWLYGPDNAPPYFVEQAFSQVWSVDEDAWVNQLRQDFTYEDGLWTESTFFTWNATQSSWQEADRARYEFDEFNRPTGQVVQRWSGDWENDGRVDYTFSGDNLLSRIQQWDNGTQEWTNFLRYQTELDEYGLAKVRTGMQSWNMTTQAWENEVYSQRITAIHTPADLINDVEEVDLPSTCRVPNPYLPGTSFSCDFGQDVHPFTMEVFDAQGRLVLQQNVRSHQSTSIDLDLPSGPYVLRVRNQQQLVHLQRLVIPNRK
ncbi:T9SS type A sorting domain-containing protein [Lewinella sp. W8]|uniref:T9SS type A sorting domain-containing protein n=1 Tax=Lewinella sp. W8 TaxID=2528208 RepID=UPI00106880FB|nr:T9SS type A sorting domain-containing protein [Lewinella sp. W8]MTB49398.1 T9SS type A sorting domain-containing protein [Lewinella sp. W8]